MCVFAFKLRPGVLKQGPGLPGGPSLKWDLEMFWEVKDAGMILTTSPIKHQLIYKNMGLALYVKRVLYFVT